jgi:hypothetical protein
MTLIFNDTLKAFDASGLYTLMAFLDNQWVDIHTVVGKQSGTVEVHAAYNKIDVDTLLFTPGQTYKFKWVDSLGNQSNITNITIPALAAPTWVVISSADQNGMLQSNGITRNGELYIVFSNAYGQPKIYKNGVLVDTVNTTLKGMSSPGPMLATDAPYVTYDPTGVVKNTYRVTVQDAIGNTVSSSDFIY